MSRPVNINCWGHCFLVGMGPICVGFGCLDCIGPWKVHPQGDIEGVAKCDVVNPRHVPHHEEGPRLGNRTTARDPEGQRHTGKDNCATYFWDVNTRRQALGGKVDKEQLFKMYELNLTLSGRSEPLTMTFIERAIFIWEKGRALQIQRMHVRAKWCFLGMGME